MSYCQLAQHPFTLLLPNTHRVSLLIPLTNHILLLIFKNNTYSIWDYIDNRQINKGKLDRPISRYVEWGPHEVLLIGEAGCYGFDYVKNQLKVHPKVKSQYSGFEVMRDRRVLVEIVESPMRAGTEVICYQFEKEGVEPIRIELAPCAPIFVKINESDLFVLVIQQNTRTSLREYSISPDGTSIQPLYNNTLNLNEPEFIVVHAHSQAGNLVIVGNNANRECEMIYYSIETQSVLKKVRLFDKSYMLHHVIGLVKEHLLLVRVSESSKFIDLINPQGHTMHSLRLDQTTPNYQFHLSLTKSTLFSLQNTNEKFIEKIKEEVPTVVKFIAYRIISKRSLYTKLLISSTKLTHNEVVSVLGMLD